MGRYIYTANGDFDGKFWFGVQPSTDCEEIYGFENEPQVDDDGDECVSYTDVWQDDEEAVRKALDKQFELAKIPKDKRKYEFEDSGEIAKYIWEDLLEYFMQETPANPKDIGYYISDDKTMYPKSNEQVLAMARVDLGLSALNDIRKHGECLWTIDY